jgi:yecA family protein
MAYNACNAIIVQSDAELSAAEAHGMATGMLCVNEETESACWLAELLHNSNSELDENEYVLVRLFEETRRLLGSDEFEFDLFLPEDDASLIEQVEALRNWCRGFLLGVSSRGSASNWPKEAREILKDIAEFTKLDANAKGEEDEHAFMEITEYLRSAVLLLRDELGNSSEDSNELWQE